jgi:hypothetical protein
VSRCCVYYLFLPFPFACCLFVCAQAVCLAGVHSAGALGLCASRCRKSLSIRCACGCVCSAWSALTATAAGPDGLELNPHLSMADVKVTIVFRASRR